MHRRNANAAADAHDATGLAILGLMDFSRLAERTENRRQELTGLELRELHGGGAHGLEDDRNGALLRVGVGDGERNALSHLLVDHENDELTGLTFARNERGLQLHLKNIVRELTLGDDFVHDVRIITQETELVLCNLGQDCGDRHFLSATQIIISPSRKASGSPGSPPATANAP